MLADKLQAASCEWPIQGKYKPLDLKNNFLESILIYFPFF